MQFNFLSFVFLSNLCFSYFVGSNVVVHNYLDHVEAHEIRRRQQLSSSGIVGDSICHYRLSTITIFPTAQSSRAGASSNTVQPGLNPPTTTGTSRRDAAESTVEITSTGIGINTNVLTQTIPLDTSIMVEVTSTSGSASTETTKTDTTTATTETSAQANGILTNNAFTSTDTLTDTNLSTDTTITDARIGINTTTRNDTGVEGSLLKTGVTATGITGVVSVEATSTETGLRVTPSSEILFTEIPPTETNTVGSPSTITLTRPYAGASPGASPRTAPLFKLNPRSDVFLSTLEIFTPPSVYATVAQGYTGAITIATTIDSVSDTIAGTVLRGTPFAMATTTIGFDDGPDSNNTRTHIVLGPASRGALITFVAEPSSN